MSNTQGKKPKGSNLPANKKQPNKRGPKWFKGRDEGEVISQLKEVWGIGGSDREAAFYAGISTAALSRYLEQHPFVAEMRNALKEKPVLLARKAVLEAIPNDPQLAFNYLIRKKPEEFGATLIPPSDQDNSHQATLKRLIEDVKTAITTTSTVIEADSSTPSKLLSSGGEAGGSGSDGGSTGDVRESDISGS